MYTRLKELVKSVVPYQTLIKYEPTFRAGLYQLYKGKTCQCNICKKGLRKFTSLENGDKLCPYCGSLSRTRRLWQLIESKLLNEGSTILDFSPSRSIYRALKKNRTVNYISTDLSGDFLSDFSYDITNIDSPDNSFELILCYHILEHIANDQQAIDELYRVLKVGGFCFIQTPFKSGSIYEDFSIVSESERLIHFGQEDHVRIYSSEGLKERLEDAGFIVSMLKFQEDASSYYGFKQEETVLLCSKPKSL